MSPLQNTHNQNMSGIDEKQKDYFDWHNIHATSFSMYMSMTFRIFICIIFYIFVKKVGIKQLTKIKCFTASARKHCLQINKKCYHSHTPTITL